MNAPVCFLRLPAVLERRACSRATLYRAVADGTFVPPVRRGRRTSVWIEAEVTAVLAAEAAGATSEELRVLVRKLIAERGTAARSSKLVPEPRDAAGRFAPSQDGRAP